MTRATTTALLCRPGQAAQPVRISKPNWRVGDEKYLEPNSTRRIELRPLLVEEMSAGYTYAPGTWMLIVRGRSGAKVRAAVKLPRHLRSNTPKNAELALEIQLRMTPALARMIDIVDMPLPE